MKAQLEAEIAALESQASSIAEELAAKRAQLSDFLASVPAEFHSMTAEVLAFLKRIFP